MQGPLQVSAAVRPNGSGKSGAPLQMDASGALIVGKGVKTTLNLAAGAHLIQAGAGRVARISVNTAQTSVGAVNDCATTGAVAAANLLCPIPEAQGIYDIDMPVSLGIVLTVGTAGVVSVSFD